MLTSSTGAFEAVFDNLDVSFFVRPITAVTLVHAFALASERVDLELKGVSPAPQTVVLTSTLRAYTD